MSWLAAPAPVADRITDCGVANCPFCAENRAKERARLMALTIADFRPKQLVLLDPQIVAASNDRELARYVGDAIRGFIIPESDATGVPS